MSVHRVLIEADYQVDDIAMGADLAVTATDGEEGVAAADDGLVGVVGVHVDAPASKQAGEDVPRSRDSLSSRAADADYVIERTHITHPSSACSRCCDPYPVGVRPTGPAIISVPTSSPAPANKMCERIGSLLLASFLPPVTTFL